MTVRTGLLFLLQPSLRAPYAGLLAALALGPAPGAAASTGDEAYRWIAPAPEVQAMADNAPLPDGRGGLFVPTITGSDHEPWVVVVDGSRVQRVLTGRRAVLEPGRYVVLVGSNGPDEAVATPVEVFEGKTTLVPVSWGALRIEVVDRRLKPHDAEYVLSDARTGRAVELPDALRPDEGEPDTWLLKPGLYELREPGSEGTSRPDFASVYVPSGGLVVVRAFMNRRTGALHGAGVIEPEELGSDAQASSWSGSLEVGGEGNYLRSSYQPGLPDLALTQVGALIDGRLAYRGDRHALDLRGSGEMGLLLLQPSAGDALPMLKTQDALSASTQYTFLLNKGAGLYARADGQTAALATDAIVATDTRVVFLESDGGVRVKSVRAGKTYRVAPAWTPLTLKTGIGLHSRLATSHAFELSLRGGPALRWYGFEGAYISEDDPYTDAIEYRALSSFLTLGAEASAQATFRVGHNAWLTSELTLFTDFVDLNRFIGDWTNDLGLRLSRALSFHLTFDATRLPEVTDQLILNQGARLRLSWTLP